MGWWYDTDVSEASSDISDFDILWDNEERMTSSKELQWSSN
jgi:hypothetical protein